MKKVLGVDGLMRAVKAAYSNVENALLKFLSIISRYSHVLWRIEKQRLVNLESHRPVLSVVIAKGSRALRLMETSQTVTKSGPSPQPLFFLDRFEDYLEFFARLQKSGAEADTREDSQCDVRGFRHGGDVQGPTQKLALCSTGKVGNK
jgi:hypothetical protein